MLGDDAELTAAVLAAQDGDETAFRTVYRAVHPRLLGYVRTLVGDPDAEDVTSEAWLQIARDLDRFSGDADRFRGWAARIARNRALDHIRMRGRRPAIGGDETELTGRAAESDTAGEAIEALATGSTLSLIAQLPQDQAEAVVLRVVVGLDAKTAAETLGKRPGAVRTAAHRGLKRLAELLGDGSGIAPAHAGGPYAHADRPQRTAHARGDVRRCDAYAFADAEGHVMADEHNKWLDRDAAERLLRGEPLEAVDADTRDQADRLAEALDALCRRTRAQTAANSPARPPRWPRSARRADPATESRASGSGPRMPAPRRLAASPRSTDLPTTRPPTPGSSASDVRIRPRVDARPVRWGRPVRFGLAAALAAGMIGGVAVAAGTGVLPSPFGGRTNPGPPPRSRPPRLPDRPLASPSPEQLRTTAAPAAAPDGTRGGPSGTGASPDEAAAVGPGDGAGPGNDRRGSRPHRRVAQAGTRPAATSATARTWTPARRASWRTPPAARAKRPVEDVLQRSPGPDGPGDDGSRRRQGLGRDRRARARTPAPTRAPTAAGRAVVTTTETTYSRCSRYSRARATTTTAVTTTARNDDRGHDAQGSD